MTALVARPRKWRQVKKKEKKRKVNCNRYTRWSKVQVNNNQHGPAGEHSPSAKLDWILPRELRQTGSKQAEGSWGRPGQRPGEHVNGERGVEAERSVRGKVLQWLLLSDGLQELVKKWLSV